MNPVKYIIESPRDALWGLTITTVGREKIKSGELYPTDCHLDSYSFSPNIGRVLQEYQLVYITEGSGTFESRESGKTKINPGMLFLLFPDEWHTYCPDKEVGWTQYWIGFKGFNMDERVRQDSISKKYPVFDIGLTEELVNLFMKAIETTDRESPYFQQMLAGIVNYMLGLIFMLDKNNRLGHDKHWIDQISRARIIMHENIESNMTVQNIAEEVGAGYSSFRKNFKKYTGLSPASYFQDLKLQRAKDLLCMTTQSVKEIAYRLNFESPDYFSAQFRKKTGKRPSDFRN